MIKTNNFTQLENIDLTKEISLIYPLDTPFTTFLMSKGLVDKGTSTIVTWREKTLDTTQDITVREGSETTEFQASVRVEKNNIMEIFKKAVQVSGTAQASSVTGITDMYAEEIADRLAEMKVNIEKKLINGIRDDGSNTGIRKMDGLLAFVPEDNKVTGELTQDTFKETVKKLWINGLGSSEFYALTNADLKEIIDNFYRDQVRYITPVTEFGITVQKITTNYGTVNIILNRHMPIDKIVIFDPNFVKLSFLRQPTHELLAKTGDYIQGHIVTECTLKVLNAKAVATFSLGE